jgi:divalent metal cation (Fe/Co/Zn/Cd) transporter
MEAASTVPGVQAIGEVKTRIVARQIGVEMEVMVARDSTFVEAYRITQLVETVLVGLPGVNRASVRATPSGQVPTGLEHRGQGPSVFGR